MATWKRDSGKRSDGRTSGAAGSFAVAPGTGVVTGQYDEAYALAQEAVRSGKPVDLPPEF